MHLFGNQQWQEFKTKPWIVDNRTHKHKQMKLKQFSAYSEAYLTHVL